MAHCKIVYKLTVPTERDPRYHKTLVITRAHAMKIAQRWGLSAKDFRAHEGFACQTGKNWLDRGRTRGRKQRLTMENASTTGVWRGGWQGLRKKK